MKKGFSINDMTVKKKIRVFSIGILLLMIVISAVGLWFSSNINKVRNNRYDNYAMGQYYLSEAYADFADAKVRLTNILYIYHNDSTKLQSELKEMENYDATLREYLKKFEERLGHFDSNIVAEYNKVADYMDEYIDSAKELAELTRNGQYEKARTALMTNGEATADAAEEALTKLMSSMEKASEANNQYVERQIVGMEIILVVIVVIAVIITLSYCMVLTKAITIPVQKLSEAAKKLALGDVDVDCEKIHNDDLGELMDNFAHMAAGIKEQTRIADMIAKGDFTVEVKPRSNKDVLGKALHKLIQDENMTLNNIKEAGAQITVGSEQVANASQALAQGSTEQASALQQVTASMDEVTQRTKANATEAGEANVLVNNIKKMAAEENGQMKDLISAMDSINESSETISKIIKTIDDIAFQTNILALNAAVEAARAGIHGKGFAVVAEEVRNLAAKSASAASETAEMIEDSIRKIGNGTKLAEETAKSLDEIVASIDEIVGLISDITVASNDQATAISQIDQAISQVSTVVQTNAATSEQCAAASEELSNQAVTLRNLIGQYKLLTSGRNSFMGDIDSNYNENEQIISLDGDFGKY